MNSFEKFTRYIAKLEPGCAPSCGYFEEIILKARQALKIEETTQNPRAIDVLDYLNQLAKRRFTARKSNLSNINARLQEGITVQQLKQIIELKVFQWGNDYTMKAHLNPETLFRPSKIEKYLQEVEDIEKNPQKFRQHVERNHQEEQKRRDRNFDPLA